MTLRPLSLAILLALPVAMPMAHAADTPATVQPAASKAEQLTKMYAEFWDESLQRNPIQATYVGDNRFNDQLPNFFSPQFRDESIAFDHKWLARFQAIDPNDLDGQARLSYDVMLRNINLDLESYQFRTDYMPLSQFFNVAYPGIVGQAVLATLATFAGMFLAYRFGLIKVTAKFRRIMTMMIFGYAIFAIVNFIFAVFWSDSPFGFGGSGGIGIAISVFAVGLASFTLALDFDSIERAIASGAPQKYSWLLAHGLIVTLVWLYIEFLRLFARLRS